jgi:hypothetical protein
MIDGAFMTEELKRFDKRIKDIEFRMIRENEKCWIKVVPLKRKSIHSSLHIILNDEYHHWDIYDKDGKEAHEIYFKGETVCPSFYLKYGKNFYKINFNKSGIKSTSTIESHSLDKFLKENCYCNSPQASCWAKSVYFTSRPDKTPFDEM